MDKVLNEICIRCNYICNAIHFQQNFKNWTSGNNDIDKFIQDAQLLTHTDYALRFVLEWIPYDRFYNIIYITKSGFGKVCRANWIDGCIDKWDDKSQRWKRNYQSMLVDLKGLNNLKNITLEFMNEV